MAEMFRVRPAFAHRSDALAFVILALTVLVLPFLIGRILPRDPVRATQNLPLDSWGFNYVPEVLKGRKPIDILILGASVAFASIDVRLLRQHLAERYGRVPEIHNLGQGRRSEEVIHQILRDVLAQRQVRSVVVTDTIAYKLRPHEAAKYFLSSDLLDFSGLPLADNAALYGAMVLGSLRQVWSQTLMSYDGREMPRRRRAITDLTASGGTITYNTGFRAYNRHDPFRQDRMETPDINPPRYEFPFWSRDQNPQRFGLSRFTTSPLQQHFMKTTNALLKARRIPAVTMVVPVFIGDTQSSQEPVNPVQDKVHVRPFYMEPRTGEVIVGLSQADLFPGLNSHQVKSFFQNEHHFNQRGAEHFTRSAFPIFEKLFEAGGG